jgi:hypothetical protein
MSDIELTISQDRKIKRAIKALNDVRAELASANPDNHISWYLEGSDNLNLMSGDSHDMSNDQGGQNYDNVIATYDLDNASGGGW